MPRVSISGTGCDAFTGGKHVFEVEATTFRRLIDELDRQCPGLGRHVEETMAVAVDGEIHQDHYQLELRPESEIFLIPKIAGG